MTISSSFASSKYRVLISATGTGGHVLPAVLIAEALERHVSESAESKSISIAFVGTGRSLESELVDKYQVFNVPIVGLKGRGIGGVLQFCTKLPAALWGVWRLISRLRPNLIIGVGGYGSFLPVTLGRLRGVRTWIHEAEVNPGLANQVLSRYSSAVSVAFPNCTIRRKDAVFSGHPVRQQLLGIEPRESLPERSANILILGGSLGANAVDQAIRELVQFFDQRGLQLWHQCRPENLDQLKELYAAHGLQARVDTFIHNLREAYEWADLIVSRAGAGLVMEISLVGRPVIFIPLPNAQGDHQGVNASFLVDAGRALLVREGEEFVARLQAAIEQVLTLDVYQQMCQAALPERPVDAAETIAKGVLRLVDG